MIIELEITNEQAHAAIKAGKGGIHYGINKLLNEEVKRQKSYNCSDNTEKFIERCLEVTENHKDVVSLRDVYTAYLMFCLHEGLDKRRDGKQVFRRRIERLDVDFGIFNGNVRGFRFLKVKPKEEQIDEDEEWEL